MTACAAPARRRVFTFYTGVQRPSWATDRTLNVPLFVSANQLARYRSEGDAWPFLVATQWAGDSGAYAALMLAADPDTNPWTWDPDSYGGLWTRVVDQSGRPPDFIGIQDWPCEPNVRARTGFTVLDHQEFTLDSYLWLEREFPWLPWLPTLQGWEPQDYVRHGKMYRRAGVDLAGRRVGVGSICRRGSQHAILAVLEALAPYGARLHGFGASINALREAGHLLASSDSQAHSAVARAEGIRLPGCGHLSRPDEHGVRRAADCRNCFRWALSYRDRALAAVDANTASRTAADQGALDLWRAAA